MVGFFSFLFDIEFSAKTQKNNQKIKKYSKSVDKR